MVINSVVLPETQRVSGVLERKVTCVGIIRLIVAPFMRTEPYISRLPGLVMAVLGLCELPEEAAEDDEDEEGAAGGIPAGEDGYQVAYAKVRIAMPAFL